MAVGNDIAVFVFAGRYCLCIAGRYFNFIHTVLDQCAVVSVLVQAGQLMFPAVLRVQRYRIAIVRAVLLELHGYASGPFAVLVIAVIPHLFNRDLCLLCLMAVGDGVAVVAFAILLEGDILRIASGDSRLVHGVIDGHAVPELIQVLPLILPVVAAIQCHRISDILSVCLQLHADAVRTDSVLISLVIPFLFNRHLNLGCCMGVGQSRDRAVNGITVEGVARGQILFIPGIIDLLSVVVLRQVLNSRGPVIGRVQGYSSHNSRAVHQVNCQFSRTDAVLVLAVIPGLGHSSGRFFFRIGNSDLAGAVSAVGVGSRTGSSCFYYIIGKCVDTAVSLILMLRQVFPFILPVVGLVQGLCVHNRVCLVADNLRNRLQSTLYRANFIGRREADITPAVGCNSTAIFPYSGF